MNNKDFDNIKSIVDLDLNLNLIDFSIDRSLKAPQVLPVTILDNKVTANWFLPSGVTDVVLELSKDDFQTIEYSKKISGNSVEITNITGNTNYKYRLKSVFNDEESYYSNSVEFLSPYTILFLHNFSNGLIDQSIKHNDFISIYGTSSATALLECNFSDLLDTSPNNNNWIEITTSIDTRIFECNFDTLIDDSPNNNNWIEITT